MITRHFLAGLQKTIPHFIFRDNHNKSSVIFLNLQTRVKEQIYIDQSEYKTTGGHCRDFIHDIITAFSISDNYTEAVTEWNIANIISYKEPVKCICGVRINERIIIENKHTKHKVRIGNVCVSNFILNNDLNNISVNINQIRDDITSGVLNKQVLDLAFKKNLITKSDYKLYKSITTGYGARKHYDSGNGKFSRKKWILRALINGRIILNFMDDDISDNGQQSNKCCSICRAKLIIKSCRIDTVLHKLDKNTRCYPFFYACSNINCRYTKSINDLTIDDI